MFHQNQADRIFQKMQAEMLNSAIMMEKVCLNEIKAVVLHQKVGNIAKISKVW